MQKGPPLRKAFEKILRILSDRGAFWLIDDLRRYGIYLDDPELSLDKLRHGLEEVLGNEATDLIMERLLIKLDELEADFEQVK